MAGTLFWLVGFPVAAVVAYLAARRTGRQR